MKCIHIDMDCFYAAIEERENPALVGKPIAVGGDSPRSVLCTANYQAREFGCRSAMPAFKAKELCPQLIIVPVRMELYKSISQEIRNIFRLFTTKIEPLSLDEAYLDVSHTLTPASVIAKEIRHLITERTQLTASAGIAPNKMIAKIASDWDKPNGQHEITSSQISDFMHALPIKKLWGVGQKSLERLEKFQLKTCGDLQQYSKIELYQLFGNWGSQLYELSRGIDNREVKSSRISKSISKETTFSENISSLKQLHAELETIIQRQDTSLSRSKKSNNGIKTNVIKLKFSDFTQTTVEKASPILDYDLFTTLLAEAWQRGKGKHVRLLGAGVRLLPPSKQSELKLFEL